MATLSSRINELSDPSRRFKYDEKNEFKYPYVSPKRRIKPITGSIDNPVRSVRETAMSKNMSYSAMASMYAKSKSISFKEAQQSPELKKIYAEFRKKGNFPKFTKTPRKEGKLDFEFSEPMTATRRDKRVNFENYVNEFQNRLNEFDAERRRNITSTLDKIRPDVPQNVSTQLLNEYYTPPVKTQLVASAKQVIGRVFWAERDARRNYLDYTLFKPQQLQPALDIIKRSRGNIQEQSDFMEFGVNLANIGLSQNRKYFYTSLSAEARNIVKRINPSAELFVRNQDSLERENISTIILNTSYLNGTLEQDRFIDVAQHLTQFNTSNEKNCFLITPITLGSVADVWKKLVNFNILFPILSDGLNIDRLDAKGAYESLAQTKSESLETRENLNALRRIENAIARREYADRNPRRDADGEYSYTNFVDTTNPRDRPEINDREGDILADFEVDRASNRTVPESIALPRRDENNDLDGVPTAIASPVLPNLPDLRKIKDLNRIESINVGYKVIGDVDEEIIPPVGTLLEYNDGLNKTIHVVVRTPKNGELQLAQTNLTKNFEKKWQSESPVKGRLANISSLYDSEEFRNRLKRVELTPGGNKNANIRFMFVPDSQYTEIKKKYNQGTPIARTPPIRGSGRNSKVKGGSVLNNAKDILLSKINPKSIQLISKTASDNLYVIKF